MRAAAAEQHAQDVLRLLGMAHSAVAHVRAELMPDEAALPEGGLGMRLRMLTRCGPKSSALLWALCESEACDQKHTLLVFYFKYPHWTIKRTCMRTHTYTCTRAHAHAYSCIFIQAPWATSCVRGGSARWRCMSCVEHSLMWRARDVTLLWRVGAVRMAAGSRCASTP